MAKTTNPGKEAPQNIINSSNPNSIIGRLFDNFNGTGKNDAEQIYKFINQPYFSWEESLINKIIEIDPSITFDQIKDGWINLGILKYSDWESDFRKCLNNINDGGVKKAFTQEIFERIQNEIWSNPPYDDFSTECNISYYSTWSTSDVISYFQKVVDYLDTKEKTEWGEKTTKILRKITIKNGDLNWKLPAWEQIPSWVPLIDESIPTGTKQSFDVLLLFEISKEMESRINKANDKSNKVLSLFSNTFPAINTIIGENEKYKFDENKLCESEKLWLEYQKSLEDINNNEDLNESEKERQINNLKWEYYIKYLKDIDPQIGDAIGELYKNDFDYSKLDEGVLKNYLDKVTDIRLKSLKDSINETLESTFGDRDFDRFSEFYKELADPSIKIIHIDVWWTNNIDIPIEKTIISQKNPLLKNIKNFWDMTSSNDCIPFQYKIKKDDIENLNIDEEDKTNLKNFLSKFKYEEDEDNYIINGEEVWNLVYLFFVVNGKIPKSQIDLEKQKETEDLFLNDKKENIEEEKSEEEKEKEIENFINNVESRWPWNKFENWSEIWLPMWDSELPGWWYQWMKIKISDVDKRKWTFTWKVFGWELKFSKNLEWKSKEFVMDEKTLDKIKNVSKDYNKIWLLPNPDKFSFNSYKEKLNGKLWTWNLSFPDGVTWDGGKFIHNVVDENWKERESEVKYFWIPWDDSISYKIKYDPIKHSFKVSTTYNWKAEKNDWKSQNVRYSYNRDMDWNNFLIFFSQKWLIPQSEDASKKAKIKQDNNYKMANWWKWTLTWFTLNNFKNAFKSLTWAIKKKVDDYNKSQDEKLQDIMIWDWWLYGKLAGILWFIPSIKNWLWELEQEYYNERDNRTWKKIEEFYKQFCADYDFADTFDQEPPYIRIKWKWSLKKQVLARVANATDKIEWDPWIYQTAWLLLANIEKWWSAYRWLPWQENEWLWIKALLGKKHYERFLEDKKKCIEAFSKEKNTDKLQDALANSEMTYIINNIYWRDAWLLFWARELRWLPGDTEHTNYLEGPAKRILSEQFAKKLEDLTKDSFTKDGVIGKMPKHNYFDKCEKDFYRLIKSARFSGAMSELEWMISLARTEAQVYTTKKCYLILMLSGILDFNWNKWLRKFAYTQWKTFWFAPAMLAKKIWHSEEIAALLDDFSGWDFSKNVTAYFHKRDLLKWKTNIWTLINQINNWFDETKMKDFDNYVESIPSRNWEGKSKALQGLKDDLTDYENQNPDEIVLKNAKLINSAWLNASADAVDTRLRVDNWDFQWKDQDEKSDIRAFWTSCSEKIDKATKSLEKLDWQEWIDRANKMLDKYLGRFWISWDPKQDVYKWINTAYRYKDEIKKSWKSDKKWEYCHVTHEKEPTRNKEWKLVEIDVPLWKIYGDDIKKILRYWLEWFVRTHSRLSAKQLPSELKTALDAFQKFFEVAFYKDYFRNIRDKTTSEDKVFNLWGWDAYEVIAQKDNNQSFFDSGDDTVDSADFKDIGEKAQKSLLRKVFSKDSYRNADIHNMRKSLKNHWVSLPKEWNIFNDTSKNVEDLQKFI